jgi:hypothetical protein
MSGQSIALALEERPTSEESTHTKPQSITRQLCLREFVLTFLALEVLPADHSTLRRVMILQEPLDEQMM